MSVDRFLDRVPGPNYYCGDLVREVWLELTGHDVSEALAGLLGFDAVGKLRRRHVLAFTELSAPSSPCLVVMQRSRSPLHIGVFIRGRVLHLKGNGVEYQRLDIASKLFKSVRFVTC